MMPGIIVTEYQLFIRSHILVSVDDTVKIDLDIDILAQVKN